MKLYFSVTVLVGLVMSCGKNPSSDFTWSPEQPTVGETVRFTNQSEDAKSYSWNLGNMSISSDENPTTVYDQKGEFIVDLSACSGMRCDQKTMTVVVIP